MLNSGSLATIQLGHETSTLSNLMLLARYIQTPCFAKLAEVSFRIIEYEGMFTNELGTEFTKCDSVIPRICVCDCCIRLWTCGTLLIREFTLHKPILNVKVSLLQTWLVATSIGLKRVLVQGTQILGPSPLLQWDGEVRLYCSQRELQSYCQWERSCSGL